MVSWLSRSRRLSRSSSSALSARESLSRSSTSARRFVFCCTSRSSSTSLARVSSASRCSWDSCSCSSAFSWGRTGQPGPCHHRCLSPCHHPCRRRGLTCRCGQSRHGACCCRCSSPSSAFISCRRRSFSAASRSRCFSASVPPWSAWERTWNRHTPQRGACCPQGSPGPQCAISWESLPALWESLSLLH